MDAQSPHIFISYRRQDSGHTGWLCEALEDAFGEERVFRDRTGIRAAHDFTVEIAAAIENADVLVAIVGQGWRRGGVLERLRRREDWVFRELEYANAHRKHILPVLLNGATMPALRSLPRAIRFFARRNALPLRDDSWDADVALITESIRGLVQQPPPEPADPLKEKPRPSRVRVWIAATLAVATAIVASFWPNPSPSESPIQPYVVVGSIEQGDTLWTRSGVIIGPGGDVLTLSGDSLSNRDTILVSTSDARIHRAALVRQQRNSDLTFLVLVRLPIRTAAHARVSRREPLPDEELVVWGMRNGRVEVQAFSGQIDSVVRGTIYYHRLERDLRGAMGAPLIARANGEVIGIHVGASPPNTPNAFGYSLRSTEMQEFLRRSGVRANRGKQAPANHLLTDPADAEFPAALLRTGQVRVLAHSERGASIIFDP